MEFTASIGFLNGKPYLRVVKNGKHIDGMYLTDDIRRIWYDGRLVFTKPDVDMQNNKRDQRHGHP